MARGFEEFEAIFGKANAEWESSSSLDYSSSPPFLPFLFHVHALDTYSLRIQVTDFHSYTWEATRSIQQLQDMRDNIGVGGSWFEFVEFLIDSLKSEDVKLVLWSAKSSADHGTLSAKLVAHKSKGMPRISISLHRLMDSSASHAMANLSLGLFKVLKCGHKSSVRGIAYNYSKHQFTRSETTKGEGARDQLDAAPILNKPKIQKLSSPDKALPASNISSLDMMTVSDKHESPKKTTQDHRSTKAVKRPVPAYRRAKVRGAVLGDSEDGDDN
ncbi:hypothetical protein ACHQM5_016527 [Ranunculus cassubicifolius]